MFSKTGEYDLSGQKHKLNKSCTFHEDEHKPNTNGIETLVMTLGNT